MNTSNSTAVEPRTSANLIRRFGLAGLIFFSVKGLCWLALPAIWIALGG